VNPLNGIRSNLATDKTLNFRFASASGRSGMVLVTTTSLMSTLIFPDVTWQLCGGGKQKASTLKIPKATGLSGAGNDEI